MYIVEEYGKIVEGWLIGKKVVIIDYWIEDCDVEFEFSVENGTRIKSLAYVTFIDFV